VLAIGLVLLTVVGLAVLHVVRPDLSPISDRLSLYANGSYGPIMTASFVTLGAGAVVLGLALAFTGMTPGWSRVVPLATIVAGCGLIVSGLFPTDPAGAPTSTETIHSVASGSASMALITAAVAWALVARGHRPRKPIGPAEVLAGAAVGLGAISPVLHGSKWTGLSQRLLWLTLTVWLLLTAWQLRSGPPARPRPASTEEVGRRDEDIERCS
jgi:hypothetical protein